MSIEKYATEAIVLNSFESGENDRSFKLFTKEFGLLTAKATSIRKEASKLRAHLHIGRISKVTLVKGREYWRIVGGEELTGKDDFLSDIAKLVERLVRGEGAQKMLFDHIYSLAKRRDIDFSSKKLLAYYLILVDLGYADAEIIGAESMSEYRLWDIDQFYIQLLLAKNEVKKHVASVLKDIQL